jgi:vacuolar-type H+-ATPase subunit E/Vma4
MRPDAVTSLDAVEEALLACAREDARVLVSEATHAAHALLGDARARAAALVEQRRAAAGRLADLECGARVAVARTEARELVLRAQQSVLTDTCAAAHVAVRRLARGPRYRRLVERFSDEARERLAAAGPVQIAAAPGGGVLARAGSREIDYSLDTQMDRILEGSPDALEALWR